MPRNMPRGAAAAKLLKGLPEEDEEMVGAPDAPQSGASEAPSAPQAAAGPEPDGDEAAMPPDLGAMMPPPGGPEGAPPAPDEGSGMDIETALAGVEASIDGFSDDAAREIRTHLEAIRDIAGKEGALGGDDKALPADQELAGTPSESDVSSSPDTAMGMDERK
jgi:hypothetical protein